MSNIYEWRNDTVTPDPFSGLQVPDALHASLQRHRENLAQLVRNLQSAGVGATQIEASINVIVASYRDELIRAIRSMMGEPC